MTRFEICWVSIREKIWLENSLSHGMAHCDTSHISFTYLPMAFMWVVNLHYLLCYQTHPYPVTLLPIGSGYFQAKPFPMWIPQHFSNLVILHLPAYEDGTDSVPKHLCTNSDAGELPRSTQCTEHNESLKSRTSSSSLWFIIFSMYLSFTAHNSIQHYSNFPWHCQTLLKSSLYKHSVTCV
jgi:hypothetical protein